MVDEVLVFGPDYMVSPSFSNLESLINTIHSLHMAKKRLDSLKAIARHVNLYIILIWKVWNNTFLQMFCRHEN